MRKREVASVLAVILLAGCGGGDSQSGASAPVGGAAPAPSPPPAPTTTYDPAFDFSADRSFEMLGTAVSRIGTIVGGDLVVSEDVRHRSTGTLGYDVNAREVRLDFLTEELVLGENLLEISRPDALMWRSLVNTPYRDDVLYVLAPTGLVYTIVAAHELEYDTTDGTNRRVEAERYLVGGSYTAADELPRTGSKSYPLSGSSSSPTQDGAGGFLTSGTASFDFSGTAFTATVELEQISSVDGNEPVTLTAELSGTVNFETNVVEGQITSPNSGYTGGFSGAFFGPAAEELAIVYTIARSGAPAVAGSMVGTSKR